MKLKKDYLKESDLVYWHDIWENKIELGIIVKKQYDWIEILSNNSLYILKTKYDRIDLIQNYSSKEDFILQQIFGKPYDE